MKAVTYSSLAKKDLRRYINNRKVLAEIKETIESLQRGEELPPNFYAHHLTGGNYAGCLECHVRGDVLLIWIDYTDENTIKVVRIGTHHQLFGL